ncbi:MAG: histidine kinase [Cytophagales bacterium]|nr:histidine kinase [Cytophagales bacterium]
MTINSILLRVKSFVNENRIDIKYHTIGWSIFYLIDFVFVLSFTDNMNAKVIIVYFSTIFLYISCFYLIVSNYIQFIPTNKLKAIGLAIAAVLIFSLMNVAWDVYVVKNERSFEALKTRPLFLYLFEVWRFSTSALYAFAYWIYLQRIKEQKLRVQTEKQLHKAELDFLKAQINPHFLFNTLNFVYGDVVSKSERAGSAILGLTNLLRYTVESTKSEQSNLKKEVDAIEEFLKLQRVRFGKRVNVTFTKNGLFPFFAMPPLVLMSLVENAFKYGVLDDPENPIEISLDVEKEGLQFGCINKVRQDFTDKETTAVGIANIKRRLDLVYKENYDLIVNNSGDIYEVILTVSWKS